MPINDLVLHPILSRPDPNTDSAKLITEIGPPVNIWGAPELLSRAIANVVDNAIKFTPANGSVTISTTVHNGASVVDVSDTGIGMTSDETRHALDRFWRSEQARSRPGHGLGLPLVQQIVDAHQGRMTIASQPGRGTTVSLIFPAQVI